MGVFCVFWSTSLPCEPTSFFWRIQGWAKDKGQLKADPLPFDQKCVTYRKFSGDGALGYLQLYYGGSMVSFQGVRVARKAPSRRGCNTTSHCTYSASKAAARQQELEAFQASKAMTPEENAAEKAR